MLTRSFVTRLTAAAACVLVAAPASAQSAAEVLQRASSTIQANGQGRADVKMDVIASGRLAVAMPDGTAVVSWRRAEDDTPGVWRVTGDLRNRKDTDPRSVDVVFTDGTASYIDHARKRVMKLAPGRSDATVSITDQVVLTEFLDDRPLIDAFEGAELALEGTAEHDGELCDVLVITHAAGSGDDKPDFKSEKWMIARSDAFPRRIERVQDLSILGQALVTLDLSNVTLGDALTGETFELAVPEGYAGVGGARSTVRPANVTPANAQTTPAPAPRTQTPAAPAYSITDVDGTTYDHASQQGRVTVLYYWGTWCVPCRTFSPLVSALAGEFADQDVDVLGLAIRERNPDAPKQIMSDKGYTHTLALGAESTVRPFNVRVFPTIVVIGPDQTILASERPRKGTSPEETMQAVRDAINKGLGG